MEGLEINCFSTISYNTSNHGIRVNFTFSQTRITHTWENILISDLPMTIFL